MPTPVERLHAPRIRRAWPAFVSKALRNIAPSAERSDTLARQLLPSQHQLGDSRQLHVGCAFVDFADLGVAPVLLYWIILGESVTAVNFYGQGGYAFRHLGAK